jgi:hypothetical protein
MLVKLTQEDEDEVEGRLAISLERPQTLHGSIMRSYRQRFLRETRGGRGTNSTAKGTAKT